MFHSQQPSLRALGLATVSSFAILSAAVAPAALAAAPPADAYSNAVSEFNIPAQPLRLALVEYAHQADTMVLAPGTLVEGRTAPAVQGRMTAESALTLLISRAEGLEVGRTAEGRLVLREVVAPTAQPAASQDAPQGEPEPGFQLQAAADSPIDTITVTAQRREQNIQDVPIAVSAFSGDDLEMRRIEGGSELLRAVPNVAFSKNNFSMYNFSIRGIGTKAISAASDPGVAISFNNAPLIRNRLFEQEYLDVSRVEVLRGPQGTLYGRNATGGVVNMIPNIASADEGFNGFLEGEVGNFDTRRLSAMVNLPITDTFAVRLAGAATQRDGFDFNTITDRRVNDRDLWSTRFSASWEPTDRFRASLVWEHFEEDDNRSRTGKQLCTPDPGPARVGAVDVPLPLLRNQLSQGCLPETLFSDDAFGTPNAGSFPAYRAAGLLITLGANPDNPLFGRQPTIVDVNANPYEGVVQSRDLREIATTYDPRFRAENDVVQFNLEFDLTDTLTLYSQTTYAKDDYWSTQDYARFPSNDVFRDTNDIVVPDVRVFPNPLVPAASPAAPGGIYTDPQLGPSSGILSADLSRSDNEQWYQEFRIQSDFGGNFEFLAGANYLKFESQDDYFVFNNLFSLLAEYFYNLNQDTGAFDGGGFDPNRFFDNALCDENYNIISFPNGGPGTECVYVDPTSIDDLAGDGHNYFRSKNVVETESFAFFAEGYWTLRDDLRLTLGARYTDDEKTATPFPTQLLLGGTLDGVAAPSSGGFIRRGFVADPDVVLGWEAVTGRAVLDWTPDLAFTDETLIYGSFARGYKGGGTNPPRAEINTDVIQYQPLEGTFEPEYLNAFEIGTKNTLFDGRAVVNLTGFYYDYEDYQVSQIVDRTSFNENFDATVWGLEMEALFRPTRNFQIDGNIGYLNTEIADGEESVDVMNRTQGNEDWTVVRPWVQVPSNCIAPTEFVEAILSRYDPNSFFFRQDTTSNALSALCAGAARFGSFDPDNGFENLLPTLQFWQPFLYGFEYNPLTDAPNGGRGFAADLGGNELPNAPNWTANIGAQYTFEFGDWELTPRADYYWQSESYFRVYNTEYDRLEAWENLNLSVSLIRPRDGLVVEGYVKNVFDDAPIVDAFTNSDDTLLTTNVFTLDPRIWGLSIRAMF
ncbi:MAG: TonB-dependent receptor [Pseudomonadota bacterium]